MNIKEEKKESYDFYNPKDTDGILFGIIKKEGMYQLNLRKKKEERKDWWYKNKSGFSINPNLIFGKIFPVSREDNNKDKYLNFVIEEIKNNEDIMGVFLKRIEYTINQLKKSNFNIENEELLLEWRMVVGLGASHPQETSMTLHHIYGIPYIPGSALKGITRHWFILKEFELLNLDNFEQINCLEKIFETADFDNEDENKRDNKLTEEEFEKKFKVKDIIPDTKLCNFLKTEEGKIKTYQSTFGTQQKRGKVIFFDAYPVESIKLKIDIMNPHYPDYYSKGESPADWQNPNPIKFLTVEKTKFRFWLASKNGNLLNEAKSLLIKALTEFGVGAKTTLGYGVFQ